MNINIALNSKLASTTQTFSKFIELYILNVRIFIVIEKYREYIFFTQLGGTQGDGYKGSEERSSPHTDYEQFVGVTVARAAEVQFKYSHNISKCFP